MNNRTKSAVLGHLITELWTMHGLNPTPTAENVRRYMRDLRCCSELGMLAYNNLKTSLVVGLSDDGFFNEVSNIS